MADMVVPETVVGVRDALLSHMVQNEEKFHVMEEKYDNLKNKIKTKEDKMADSINFGGESGGMNTAALAAMLSGRGGGDGMFGGGGGGGMIGGLILGSLLRNNGNLFGGNGDGGVGGAVLRSPPEQVQANMDLMASIGAVDKAVAVSTAAMESSQAQQSAAIVGQFNSVTSSLANRIDTTKEAVNAGTMILAQQLNGVQASVDKNAWAITTAVSNDGDKTRALLVSQYEATLNRQLSEANNALAELRSDARLAERTRGIEVTTTNNINQMQQQQQQQNQFSQLTGLIWSLGQQIRSGNDAINVGSGTLTANPTNTNTNIK
jgi:hypothetical protein